MSRPTPKDAKTEQVGAFRNRAEAKAEFGKLLAFRGGGVPTGTQPATGNAGSTGELWLYGLVGGWWSGFDADGVADALRGMEVDNLIVRIHSPGGLATDGIAIGNLLRNYDAHVTVVIDGIAASAASVIAVAGDDIVMCPGSQMMLHDAMTGGYGNADDLRQAADWIDAQSQNYAGVYASAAGGTADEWRQVMRANGVRGTWYTADAAVEAGLATEVGTRPAVSSPPTTSVPEVDEDDDEMWALAVHDLELLQRYVPAAASAVWQGEAPKPPTASAEGSTETEGGSAVAFSDVQMTELRSTLGLADDADEAAIVAAAAEIVDKVTEPPAEGPTASAQIPEGMVLVPEARLSDLEINAKAGKKASEDLHANNRETFLNENKAKFAATNRQKWADRYDTDPAGTIALFADAADLIPTTEDGHASEADESEVGDSTALASITEAPGYKNWEM